jgi:hypothetical protein
MKQHARIELRGDSTAGENFPNAAYINPAKVRFAGREEVKDSSKRRDRFEAERDHGAVDAPTIGSV